ncbi:MAG: hypothetical protein COA65_01500 [Rhodospirillaceae bacterium]|nr:MAG: hypothetical protein COA65_01500 [Rhodospirillaceae bacterium]
MGAIHGNPAQAAWEKLCHHIDGLAIGSTVATLEKTGVLAKLADATTPLPLDALAAAHGLKRGYVHLAARLLALQGWVERSGDILRGDTHVLPTKSGRAWLNERAAYRAVPSWLAFARSIAPAITGKTPLAPMPPLPKQGGNTRIPLQLRGAAMAALMATGTRTGLFTPFGSEAGRKVALAELPAPPETLARVFDLLLFEGWIERSAEHVAFTAEGAAAMTMAPQYFHSVSYLETLAAVPELMRGGATVKLGRDNENIEGHVDREMDVRFSGLVFARNCRDPFFEVALPLFDNPDLSAQPCAVVDCGAGDGTLLRELYQAIATRTRRGAQLARYPLTMVGVEYNRVAQDITSATLRDADVPHRTLAGDIGEPAALADALAAAGLAPENVLHVSKSVIHNRNFRGYAEPIADPLSQAVFVSPDGSLIPAAALEADLGAFFAAWQPHISRHGMIVIEAHVVAPELAAARIGGNVLTCLEATHGFSHQYLVEIDVHRRAAWRAGLRPYHQRDLGAAMVGAPILSLDHYRPA